jgi:cobalt/nickel transport system permease protein
MIDEPFAFGRSVLHRTDPRFKLVFAVLFSVVTAVAYRFPVLLAALATAVTLAAAARLQPAAVAARLLPVVGFLLLLWLLLPLTFEGTPLASIGPLTLSRPGVVLAAQISLKSVAILLSFMALVATMSFATLGRALDSLHVPSKIVHLLLMTYRYIFVIEQEYRRLLRAAKIRSFKPGTNLHTYRTVAYFVGMLFVRAAARAERVHQAMRCRGFNGRFYCLAEFAPHPRNWVFAALMSATVLALAILEWGRVPV